MVPIPEGVERSEEEPEIDDDTSTGSGGSREDEERRKAILGKGKRPEGCSVSGNARVSDSGSGSGAIRVLGLRGGEVVTDSERDLRG